MKNILIVEDNDINRDILKTFLAEEYNVIEVENGNQAVRYLQKNCDYIDLIILDIIMPEIDGFQFLKYATVEGLIVNIPIIVASIIDTDLLKLWAMRLNIAGYLEKPYDSYLTLQLVQDVLN